MLPGGLKATVPPPAPTVLAVSVLVSTTKPREPLRLCRRITTLKLDSRNLMIPLSLHLPIRLGKNGSLQPRRTLAIPMPARMRPLPTFLILKKVPGDTPSVSSDEQLKRQQA